MRLVPHPIGLVPRMIKPTSGPVLLSAPTGMTKFVQSIMAPTALFGIDVEYPIKRESQARAVAGMILDLEGGANVLRFPYRDAHEPRRHEFGLAHGEWNEVPWSNGLPWGNGKNWRTSPPTTVAMVDAEIDAVEVIVSIAAWPFTLKGARFGFAGHWGVYTVQDAVVSGSVATLWIWPGLRRRVTAGTIVTLRPTVGLRLVGPDAGTFSDTIQGRSDITLSLIEVPDATIRTYASEHRPSPTYSFDPNPWYLSTSLRTIDGHMPVEVLQFDEDRYALPYGLTAAAVATASVVHLTTLEAVAFADGVTLSASSTAARTRYDENDHDVADCGVDEPRFDYLIGDHLLLLENASANLLTYSDDISNASWTKSNVTVTNNAATSPSGATDADRVVEAAGSSNKQLAKGGFSVTSGQTYSLSFDVDPDGRSWAWCSLDSAAFGGSNTAWFDVASVALGTVQGATTARIVALPNGWVRCIYTRTAIATGATALYIGLTNANGVNTYTGDGVSGEFIWRVGVEAGAYATAGIPTTSAAVTRTIETATESALALALAKRSAWTGVLTFTPDQIASGVVWQVDDGTSSNWIQVGFVSGVVSLSIVVGAATVFYASASTPLVAGVEATIAWRCRRGQNRISVGGGGMAAPLYDTGAALPTGLTQSAIARNLAGTLRYAGGRYRRHLKYAAAVSDAALAALSVGPT